MAENKEKPKQESTAIVKQPSQVKLGIIPTNIQDAYTIAVQLAKSGLVPDRFREKPQDALAAILWGTEIGVPPMSSLKGIAVVRGNPSLYGDLFLSVIMSHPEFEDFEEVETGKNTDDWTWTCTFYRKGRKPKSRTYSKGDAITAKLWGKTGEKGPTPWVTNPGRMLQMRARGFAGRDQFPDALAGMVIREEAMDYEAFDHPEDDNATIQMPRRVQTEAPAGTAEVAEVPPGDTVAGGVPSQPATEPAPLTPRSYTEPEDEELKNREQYVKIWEDIAFMDDRWKPDPNFGLMSPDQQVKEIERAKYILKELEVKKNIAALDPKKATVEEMLNKKPAESKTRTEEPVLDLGMEPTKEDLKTPMPPVPEIIPPAEPEKKLKKDMTTAEKYLGPVESRPKPDKVLTGEYERVLPMHTKKLHVVLNAAKVHTEEQLYAKMWKSWGIESSADIPRSEYQKVLAWASGDKFKIKG